MTHPQAGLLVGLWGVDSLRSGDGALEPPLDGSAIAVMFDEGGNVMGNAGCNSYRGSCQIDGDEITFGTLASTRRSCMRPPGVMEQEARFLRLLTGTVTYSLGVDGTLILFDEPDAPLVVMSRRDEEPTEAGA